LEAATALLHWSYYFFNTALRRSHAIDLTSNNTTLCITKDETLFWILMGYDTSRIIACSLEDYTKMNLQEVG
jgi:hypothetical protein